MNELNRVIKLIVSHFDKDDPFASGDKIEVGKFVVSADFYQYYDSGQEYAPESDDGYRRAGSYQARKPGMVGAKTLAINGKQVYDSAVGIQDNSLLTALEKEIIASSPTNAINPGESIRSARSRLLWAQYDREALPELTLPWVSANVYIGESGPYPGEEAANIKYYLVLTNEDVPVSDAFGWIDNSQSKSGKFVQASISTMYLDKEVSKFDPRIVKYTWVK